MMNWNKGIVTRPYRPAPLSVSAETAVAGGRERIIDVLGTPGALARNMRILREDQADGSFILRNSEPLGEYAPTIPHWLLHWARTAPERVFLAERVNAGQGRAWRSLTYKQTLDAVRAVGQALIDRDIDPERPVVVVSGNSVNNAVLSLAAMITGRMIATVSVAYSLRTRTHEKLHGILEQLNPGLVYAEDGEAFGPGIESANLDCPIVYTHNAGAGSESFEQLLGTEPTAAVEAAHERVTADTVARLLLTSGSTGKPKLVENTHRMLCANQTMIAQCWPFVDDSAPVVLDWLPWSHTFGANHNFNIVLRNGGSLYIDDGAPMPGLVERTIENLKEVRPTLYFNVPRGFGLMLPLLEADEQASRALFERLQMLFYAAAALPVSTWHRLEALAEKVRSAPLFFTSEWGSTETSPVITNVHFKLDGPGNLGVPVPGMELKFVPNGDKLEMRVRGVSVFARYRNNPTQTREAFDEQGFYKIGDAGVLADPNDPNKGVIFNGRVSEDFKLTTGTWVSVGPLGVRAVGCLAPHAQDVVVCGHDRDEVGLMIFPSPQLRALAGDPEGKLSGKELAEHPQVRAAIAEGLAELCTDCGSSQRASRAILLSSLPDIDAGEITDKGYINQRAVRTQRAHEVERLYSQCTSVIHV